MFCKPDPANDPSDGYGILTLTALGRTEISASDPPSFVGRGKP